jgi:phenylacetate 2-hydroxylase
MAFGVFPAADVKGRPILNSIECNANLTSLTIVSKPFKIGFWVRDQKALEGWIWESETKTNHLL